LLSQRVSLYTVLLHTLSVASIFFWQFAFAAENLYESSLTEARRRLAIQDKFMLSHPYRDESVGLYVEKLKRENFACRIQYRTKTSVDPNNPLALQTVPEAGIECFNEKFGQIRCENFRVGLRVAWSNDTGLLEDLKAKLKASRIAEAVFVCESKFTRQEREAVLKGIRDGYVMPI
jgi:hypothetical protein